MDSEIGERLDKGVRKWQTLGLRRQYSEANKLRLHDDPERLAGLVNELAERLTKYISGLPAKARYKFGLNYNFVLVKTKVLGLLSL